MRPGCRRLPRLDLAHTLVKDLSEPLRDLGAPTEWHGTSPPGSRRAPIPSTTATKSTRSTATGARSSPTPHPHRTAVAEAWVPTRRVLYATRTNSARPSTSSTCKPLNLAELREVITGSLADARAAGAWRPGCCPDHDVVRHATRLVLPPDTDTDAWLLSGGHAPAVDPAAGLRRAGAATLLMLALPGSAYLPGRGAGTARGGRPAHRGPSRTRSGSRPATSARAATAAGCRCPGRRRGPRTGSARAGRTASASHGLGGTAVPGPGRSMTLELYRTALPACAASSPTASR
ncbi:Glycoside hydrolase family 13 protein OS=Streptomyces tendae OX=1932 GN=GUR47_20510 PE=4 SV=1 [Streptomyces tendae]